MKSIARFVTRFSKMTLAVSIALIAIWGYFGVGVFATLQGGGYDDTKSDSAEVYRLLETVYDQRVPEVILIVDFNESADSESAAEVALKLSNEVRAVEGVRRIESYYTLNRPESLRSKDNQEAYFFVHLVSDAANNKISAAIQDKFQGDYGSAFVHVAGWTTVATEINGQISKDLAFAEMVAVPVTILLLLFVFGSIVSAGLPFIVAIFAIIGSFFALWLTTQFTEVSVFSVNLVTGLGLGLGVDYALLMVNRFREERAKKLSVEEATRRTIETAGRTVVFSGLTVATVVLALSFFPQYFLKSFAYAGFSVVMLAMIASIFTLPALFNLLGDKVNLGKVKFGNKPTSDSGTWANVAKFVMRKPLAVLTVTLIALGSLASFSFTAKFGQVDDRILPADNPVVLANDQVRKNFQGREATPIEIIIEGATQDEIQSFAEKVSRQEHIVRVQSTSGFSVDGQTDLATGLFFGSYKKDNYQRIVAITDIDSRSTTGYNLITKLRSLEPVGEKLMIGGSSAVYTDSMLGITNNIGIALAFIIGVTLILIFFFTGSVVLPIKAVILNLLSLSATLGFITWVFQDGNLQWLTGPFQTTGTIDSSTMVLVAIIAFGLSMDYELFLLSRIKEQHELGKDTIESVSIGLQRSGRLITTAALVLAVSFIAFLTSNVSIMKMLGLGIAFAILLDAIVVRALLVPALMRLFGKYNWWAPKWLKAIYRKVGFDH